MYAFRHMHMHTINDPLVHWSKKMTDFVYFLHYDDYGEMKNSTGRKKKI